MLLTPLSLLPLTLLWAMLLLPLAFLPPLLFSLLLITLEYLLLLPALRLFSVHVPLVLTNVSGVHAVVGVVSLVNNLFSSQCFHRLWRPCC
jgi:hypothetical protein